MRSLFAEGSFSSAFVPTLAMYKQTKTSDEVKCFIANMSGVLGLILLLITLIGVLGSQGLITVFAPGLDPYRFELANTLLKWTFPYLMLISLTAFVGATLNNYGQFWVPAFTPALLNICLIVSALWLTRYFVVPVTAQAVGVFIAGFLQLGFQLPFLKRMGFLQWLRFDWRNSGVRAVLKRMLPALFGASVVQIGLLLNTVLASFLVAGSVTWLYYSDRLAYFPLGVFGVALSTVILPHLSRQHAMQSTEGFSSTLNWGLRCNLLVGLPASLCLVLLAQPIIITLLHYGKFGVHDVLMTQQSVMAYALGLQAFMFIKVLAAAFYAQHNLRTPVQIGVLALGANLLFSLLLIGTLKHAGLALASSLSAWINVILLLRGLRIRRYFSMASRMACLYRAFMFSKWRVECLFILGDGGHTDLVCLEWTRAVFTSFSIREWWIGFIFNLLVDQWITMGRSQGDSMTELIRGLAHLTLAHQPCVATIGNFDGVHQGHLAVIHRLQQQGAQQKLPTCIILFEPHPQEFFLKEKAPARLMRLCEKIAIFRQLGVDRVLCLPFRKIVALSAEEFVVDILVKRLGITCLIVGDDFRFGKGRQGDYTQLQNWAQRYHFILEATPTTYFAGKRIGSSWVREALRQGNFNLATQLLTRPFQFSGRVIRGDQRGRLLGFPTANLALKRQVVPLSGVFAVRIHGLGASYLGVANCGSRPTVSGNKMLLEVHLFDFNDDLYGKRIEVEFVDKIRDEKRFDSLEALRQQIQQDSESAKKRLIAVQ